MRRLGAHIKKQECTMFLCIGYNLIKGALLSFLSSKSGVMSGTKFSSARIRVLHLTRDSDSPEDKYNKHRQQTM